MSQEQERKRVEEKTAPNLYLNFFREFGAVTRRLTQTTGVAINKSAIANRHCALGHVTPKVHLPGLVEHGPRQGSHEAGIQVRTS
ncbi:hypothetical protein PAPYR_11979 [Paratrimastix pyriformis]|uniref:Uncharacterized protein n=1 Tax=Paratrimastix pyriformis TaxID=342808 RepID=A0ABQ8U860_9EUKA|nr:hypothetical protein PAPYR_11979 [Paratrimastix pyriformis]